MSLQFFVDIQKMLISLTINIPMDANDQEYQKEFFRTAIDADKMFRGVHGNFAIKMFTEPYFKALNISHPAFPIPKGIYAAKNFTISDSYIPFNIQTKALVQARYVGKIANEKSTVLLYSWKAFVEIDKRHV